ncbi:protein MNN4-like [Agrilus planipennis]|uniref:Protein MNN4-like n=1 Tax=Agrilus planipennis TaxID=224129 RepID=A0A1W4X9P8_AGRPL|nr:protein MNN4-like [Agrilus planipennis]
MLEIKQNFNSFNSSVSNKSMGELNEFSQSFGTLRKYFNPAVYVETPLVSVNQMRKSSSSNLRINENTRKIIKIKKCVCFTDPENCTHSLTSMNSLTNLQACKDLCGTHGQPRPTIKFSPSSSTIDDDKQSYTVDQVITDKDKAQEHQGSENESFSFEFEAMERSNPNDLSTPYEDDKVKQEAFRRWLIKKEEEKKRKKNEEASMKDLKEEEKKQHLEKERENFARWLSNKKQEEERKKMEEEKKKKDEMEKMEVKKFRTTECDLRYKLWLKKKEQAELDRKIKEQMKIMKITEEKERKKALNEKAYQDWLRRSKNKPKPLPLNQGLESLKSSLSVTYINPTPWNPNIPQNCKPISK